jgi:hypothetical protein
MGVTVSFKTDSTTLDTNAKGALDGVSKWMHSNDQRTVKLQGYADPTGNVEANQLLSEKRADTVRDYLVEQGIDPNRVTTVGRGEAHTETSLPAEGRTVTFIGCQPAMKVAEATPPPPPPAPEAAPPAEAAPPEPVAPVEETPPPPVAAVPPSPTYEAAPQYRYGSIIGMQLLVGGGYSDFVHNNIRNVTNPGGSWDARLVAGTRSFIGAEVAYVGTANSVDVLGATSSTLVGNGVEGAIRLQVPIILGYGMLEPYGFGGVGWMSYRVTNNRAAFTDFSTRSDDIMTVPAGGGVTYVYKAFTVDVRGSWTGSYFNNILLNTSGNNRLDRWGAGGHLGVAF